jgi:hypothetical protein
MVKRRLVKADEAESQAPAMHPGEVLSALAAKDAEQNPKLLRFRSEVLDNQLVDVSDVANWLHRQAALDGAPTTWIEAPVAPGDEIHQVEKTSTWALVPASRVVWGIVKIGPHDLSCLDGEGLRVTVLTARDGKLEWLKDLAAHLSAYYGWGPEDAARFILCGVPPQITLLTIAREFNGRSEFGRAGFHIKIDALVSPKKLAEAYRREREQAIPKRRIRPLSQKHLMLVHFANQQPPKLKIREQLKVWNEQFPQWSYRQESNFYRDRTKARKRLLGSELQAVALEGLAPTLKSEGLADLK